MRATILLCSVLMLATACQQKATVPTDKDIEKAIVACYESNNGADGGGGRHADHVNVLRKRPGENEQQYYAEVEVKGTQVSPPLANPVPDQPFTENREFQLVWNDGQWKCANDQ